MPKTAKKKPAKQQENVGMAAGNQWAQSVSASNLSPTWATYVGNTTASPNIMWQGTTSGATYTAASSVLTT